MTEHSDTPAEPTDLPPAPPERVMWQRIIHLPSGQRVLLTCWDDDPTSLQAALRVGDRWGPPLRIEEP